MTETTGGIGATLKARLATHGITTIRAAAAATGIPRTTLHRILTGQTDPNLGQLSVLAAVLDTTPSELLNASQRTQT